MKDFNVAADNINVHFQCPKCKGYVEYSPTALPVPDFSVDRDADSERTLEDSVICDNCGTQYNVDVRKTMSNGAVIVMDEEYNEVEDIEVDEVFDPVVDDNGEPTYLDSFDIFGLWRKYDIHFDFKSNVTIITGGNGSGKSTALKIIEMAINNLKIDQQLAKRLVAAEAKLSKGIIIEYRRTRRITNGGVMFMPLLSAYVNRMDGPIPLTNVHRLVQCVSISTFDNPIDAGKLTQLLKNTGYVSELDLLLDGLENKFAGYLGELGTMTESLINDSPDSFNELRQSIYGLRNKYYDIIDQFFSVTNKTISRKDSKFLFNQDGIERILTWKDLSSGEKQVLYIFTTLLLQKQSPKIILMDEPEISMHVDWQEILIEKILEMNPNCQLIIATHSPSLISLKWQECVVNIDDIKTKWLR